MGDLLRLDAMSAGYGQARTLFDVSLTLRPGGTLAVLGRNGVGKTTLINTVVGMTTLHGGRLWLGGNEITRAPSHHRAIMGIGWVPQEREIFLSLTVEENVTAVLRPGAWTLRRIYRLFPRLEERRANMGGELSGGEQQMLAIGRALALNPALLLLDEPLEGLAPVVVQELLVAIQDMITEGGIAVIIVEQHANRILPLTEDVIVLQRGHIVHSGRSRALSAAPEELKRWLGAQKGQTPASSNLHL